jgi:hypothetical protein
VATGRRSPDPGPAPGRPTPSGPRTPAAAPPPSPNGSGQNQDEQAQGDPSEAPGFGDRISRRRQSAALGHQLSAKRAGLIHPGFPGGSIAWKAGWSHGRQQEHPPIPAALPARAA